MEFYLNKEAPFLPFVNCSKSIEMTPGIDVFTEIEEQHSENICSTPIPTIISKYLLEIINYIKDDEGEKMKISNTFGTKASPFGTGRLRLLNILTLCFDIEDSKIISSLCEVNTFEMLLVTKFFEYYLIFVLLQSLVGKYEWNNFLHRKVKEIFVCILESRISEYKKYVKI